MSPIYRILTILFVFSIPLQFPLTANAHKLSIFAWPEGNIIRGQTAFSGNRKPKNVKITVQDAASHTILLTAQTDKQGRFSFTLPEEVVHEQLDLLLVVNSGNGHRGECLLSAAEYLTHPAPAQPQTEDSHKTTPAAPVPSPTVHATSNHIDEQLLRRIVAEELEKKITPLKYILAKNSNNSPNLRDILGGIGYLLGLAGILTWMQARNRKKTVKTA